MKKLPFGTYILACAQALNLTTAVISVTISAIVGGIVSEDKSLSTIPYGLQFAAVMIFTFPVAKAMGLFGRKIIFNIGAVLLFVSGGAGFFAVEHKNFYTLCAAHFILGIYISIANYYRFAATDTLNNKDKARAMSVVVAGGVMAAFLGPLIANNLKSIPGFLDFSICYAAMSLVAILTAILICFWTPKPQAINNKNSKIEATKGSSSHLIIAIIASSWGYLSMNLLMIQASLVMQNICTFSQSSAAIQVHVAAMFLPSFFTGYFIEKIGHVKFILIGFTILSLSAIINSLYLDYNSIYTSLIALGIGWNFMYVGGGALLSKHLGGHDKYRWQGINDTSIAMCATIGALLPAPLFFWIGWTNTNEIILAITIAISMISVFTVINTLKKLKEEAWA